MTAATVVAEAEVVDAHLRRLAAVLVITKARVIRTIVAGGRLGRVAGAGKKQNFFMKTILLLFISAAAFGQRQSYIDTVNQSMFLQLGTEREFFYDCKEECTAVTMTITDEYFKRLKLKTYAARKKFAITMLEQYDYLFKAQGFKLLTVRAYGVEEISKDLTRDL